MEDMLLTPAQVAERLQLTEQTIYMWLRSGQLPGVKLGRLWRIRKEDLDRFITRAAFAENGGRNNEHP